MPTAPLPCIVCGTVPESAFPDTPPWTEGAPTQPYGATTFFSAGQYGSTVWDPQDTKQMLRINICDTCLRVAAARHCVVVSTRVPKEPQYSYKEWEPDE